MKCSTSKIIAACSAAAFVALAGSQMASAQDAPAPKPKIVLKQDLEGVSGKEVALSLVEFPPGSAEVPHTHPAELFVFVREGEVSLETEGKPTTSYKVGDVFSVGTGKVHRVSNNGTVVARTVAFFVAEKGKPLTLPTAPAK